MERITMLATAAVSAAVIAGCAPNDELPEPGSIRPSLTARTEAVTADGQVRATVTAGQIGDSVRVEVEARGLRPGTYAAHVHTTGRCDPPAFTSAGPHWNPTQRQHGMQNPQGQHLGDLPNLTVDADGRGRIQYTIPNATLSGGANPMLDGDGAAFVIHAGPDDHRTDPSGNSGDRIACGVFGLESP